MASSSPAVLATFVTSTTYGTWLPGDLRGYVEAGEILPPDPARFAEARHRMRGRPVYLTADEQRAAFAALCDACREFRYTLHDASVESWHAHWCVAHAFDPVDDMVGRLKTRMRQAVGRGRVWTEGYCHRCLYTPREMQIVSRYVSMHRGCRMTCGVVAPAAPGAP